MGEEAKTTTEGTEGKLPLDIETKPDDKGNVKLEKKKEEAPPKEAEAKEGDETEKPKEEGAEEAPTPKTFSEEEHNQLIESIKGGHKGTVDKLKGDMKGLTDQIAALQLAQEEKEIAGWLNAVEQKGSEEEISVAKVIAERDKESRRIARESAAVKAELDSQSAILEQAGRGKMVSDLITTYALPKEAAEALGKAESPAEMENTALKLHVEKIKADARNPENPPKAVKPAPKGKDDSGKSIEQRLGAAIEEWEAENQK